MSILFKVAKNEISEEDSSFIRPHKCILCKISPKNIIAYCLQDEAREQSRVRVCDIVTPWHSYQVVTTYQTVTVLEWNHDGQLLLIGYNNGDIELWVTHQETLNVWVLIYTAKFIREEIFQVIFFNNSKNIFFHTQKKESFYYKDKFEHLKHAPTLTKFGGIPTQGCLVVTTSGMIAAFLIPLVPDFTTTKCVENLRLTTCNFNNAMGRKHLVNCSMSYCRSGAIKIALSCYKRTLLIQCLKVSISMAYNSLGEGNLKFDFELMPNVFIDGSLNPTRITNLKWVTLKNEDFMFVGYECATGNVLQQYNLITKSHAVHPMLANKSGEFFLSERWENTGQLLLPAEIRDVCMSKLYSANFQIFVILADNSVHFLDLGLKRAGPPIYDKVACDPHIVCEFVAGDVSSTNQILIVFNNCKQMYAIHTSQPLDKCGMKTIPMQVSLLEYSIMTGIDSSDALICILLQKMCNLELLTEKLTENFTRQSASERQLYYSNFLSLKSTLCRIQSNQRDFDDLIILHAISITFKNLLRPAESEKNPTDSLAVLLSDTTTDIDKILYSLDAKEFTVESQTLQSLQHLIQWVTDLAVNILHKLPEDTIKSKLSRKQGYDIGRDNVAIGNIRELFVLIRIWGVINPQCLPIYTKSIENIDVLPTLFRLLARLAQNTTDPDDLLLDECNALSTQILIPSYQIKRVASLLSKSSPLLAADSSTLPLTITPEVDPIIWDTFSSRPLLYEGGTKDGITNTDLGSKFRFIRRCVRCGFVFNFQDAAKSPILSTWNMKWQYCHCGGFWIVDEIEN